MCKYLIHYFSGTGNTYHMVKIIEHELKNRDYEVDVLNIEKDKDKKLNDYEKHIFCFPVYGFGTPSIMLKYISKLNIINSKAAIICTSAGFEGQSLSRCKYLLKEKGFEVFFTEMITYTYNWTQIINPQSKEIEERVFKEAETKGIDITQKIINNEINFKKTNIIVLILSWVIFSLFCNLGRRILGKTFIADDTCINCGKCKNICPAKAINMYNGKPRWNRNCESCQRCINICPKKSIQLSIAKLAVFVILELLPVFIIVYMNNYIYDLSIIVKIILYCGMFLINTFIASILISIMENVRIFRRIFKVSYIKKYRRNIAKGFNIKSKN